MPIFKRNTHLHSREHVLADDLSRSMGEPKRFASYLGIAKLYNESDLRALARYVVEKKDLPVEVRGKYFFGALRRLPKKFIARPANKIIKKSRYRPSKARTISRIRDFVSPTWAEKQNRDKKVVHVLPIIKEPNKVLRNKARPVPVSDISSPKIQRLILDMKETLKKTTDGVGLAASQVGESLQIFLVSSEAEAIDNIEKKPAVKPVALAEEGDGGKPYETKAWQYYVFINPVVKNISKRKLDRAEGCLSVPGKFGNVLRTEKITIEAHDENGKKFTRGSSRFFARVVQHELDHLFGILFIDKAKKVFVVKLDGKT
ncbi:MAG: peptide deformylase [bacterium]|nr:peptide deformylase [bacterium]